MVLTAGDGNGRDLALQEWAPFLCQPKDLRAALGLQERRAHGLPCHIVFQCQFILSLDRDTQFEGHQDFRLLHLSELSAVILSGKVPVFR